MHETPRPARIGHALLTLLLLFCALQLVLGPYVRISQWRVPPDVGSAWLEARAWLDGRADLGAHQNDFALRDGRWFNPLPPLFTFLSVGALSLQRLLIGPSAATDGFYPGWYVLLVAAPLPLLGMWAFRNALIGQAETSKNQIVETSKLATDHWPLTTAASAWSALLTFAWLAGTAMHPTLQACRDGSLNYINHALSQVALLLIAGDLLGRRRWWPAAVGLVIGAWTRQLTILYSLPLLFFAWRCEAAQRRRATVCLLIGCAVAAAGLLTVNFVRFRNPLDFGYARMYAVRTDPRDLAAEHFRTNGVFGVSQIRDNFWYMNLAISPWEWTGGGLRPVRDVRGASMWYTTPLLLLVLWDARRWWRDPRRRALMLGSFLVIIGLLLYHDTGVGQPGYHRYALDFLPIWFAVLAPGTIGPRRSTLTLVCIAWSTLYYSLVV